MILFQWSFNFCENSCWFIETLRTGKHCKLSVTFGGLSHHCCNNNIRIYHLFIFYCSLKYFSQCTIEITILVCIENRLHFKKPKTSDLTLYNKDSELRFGTRVLHPVVTNNKVQIYRLQLSKFSLYLFLFMFIEAVLLSECALIVEH